MIKYEEERIKYVERNKMSFVATLAVTELLEQGRLTKEEIIEMVKKNTSEQKHPERAEQIIEFVENMNSRSFLAQFGWRIFDLQKYYEEHQKLREEVHARKLAEHEERLRLAKEEKAARKNKNKVVPKKPEPAPEPKRRVVVKIKKS